MAMDAEGMLGLATVVLCGGVVTPLLFPRWPVWARALWRVTALVVLTVLVQRIFGSPLRPQIRPDGSWERVWQQAVEAGWWVVAARSVAGVARLAMVLQNRSRETQILSDLIGAAIYGATALAVIDVVFSVSVGGLIATSGVIAVVIGLALQSTLSDVFSGIAIDIERPYRAGDFVTVEGGVQGRVREVKWRSTLIATVKGDLAVVPNSVMAKARLVNHSLPLPVRRTTVGVRLDPRVMPDRCMAALQAALEACRLPLADPAPAISQTALRGDGAAYEIAFSVAGGDVLDPARTEVLAQVQRHLFHSAIPLAVEGVAALPSLTVPTAADLLAGSDMFGVLAEAERALLAAAMAPLYLVPGETLFGQGDAPEALFVVASGTVGILRRDPDGAERHFRISPGTTIGAIGLITGSPYAAGATALTPVKVYRLDKVAITAAITERPSLTAALEELARRGQAAMSADIASATEPGEQRPDLFLSRMRLFLQRLAVGIGPGLSP